uniref:Peptidase C1A papain C-terminal domain-containing protein n=1 Tax=viral metagenome TaxID=1070528 RepID=A0A6C0IU36_9ZZZZ
MFKFILFILFFSNIASSQQTTLRRRELNGVGVNDETFHWSEFSNFQERFNKRYSTLQELETRFAIFKKNLITILEHNSDFTQNFTMGVNQFTDLTNEEFKSTMIKVTQPVKFGSYGCQSFTSTASGAPNAIDWRTKGAVTNVKDQGQCGSCWTFSATGAIEGAWAIAKDQLINFSEQELVDCATGASYGSHGCNGGIMDGAFKFVMENGQCTDASYPYSSGVTKTSGTCQKCSSVAHITSCYDVKPNDQVSLKGAVSKQPIAIALSADTKSFQLYKSGVLTATDCYTSLNHGVLISAYGEENGLKYWLVKNSWGTTWGDEGYIKILRSESTNDAGICGIAMMPSFPKV